MNVSPESFSNWILSLGDDDVTVPLVWLAATHLLLTLAVALPLLPVSA